MAGVPLYVAIDPLSIATGASVTPLIGGALAASSIPLFEVVISDVRSQKARKA